MVPPRDVDVKANGRPLWTASFAWNACIWLGIAVFTMSLHVFTMGSELQWEECRPNICSLQSGKLTQGAQQHYSALTLKRGVRRSHSTNERRCLQLTGDLLTLSTIRVCSFNWQPANPPAPNTDESCLPCVPRFVTALICRHFWVLEFWQSKSQTLFYLHVVPPEALRS